MIKNDLTNRILNTNRNIFAIVGPNTSGKSYYLTNDLYYSFSENILLLDEDGRFKARKNMTKVKISGNNYVYDYERYRGIDDREVEIEQIKPEILKLINCILNIKKRFNVKIMSLGSRKVLNVINTFLSYNLNHIDYFLFDEPESSLDDENIKYITKIFDLLVKSNKKIIFITHSPRFLEMLQIKIDDIYVFPKIGNEIINHSFSEIETIFNEVGEKISRLKPNNDEKEYVKYDFLPNTKISKLYLEELLKSTQFYRTLFYTHIIIVEGNTEELIANELSKELDINKCIFKSYGKYKILFLIGLFSMYSEKLSCVIDSDEREEGNSSLASLLTFEIEKCRIPNKCYIYVLPNDLENYLKFDKNEIVSILSNYDIDKISNKFSNNFSKYYKQYLPLYVIKNNDVARTKVKNLFNKEMNYYNF